MEVSECLPISHFYKPDVVSACSSLWLSATCGLLIEPIMHFDGSAVLQQEISTVQDLETG